VGDNGPIDATLKVLSDGLGTNLPMEASTTGINFTGTLQQGGVAVPTQANLATKQDTLVSGTNIKTVNSTTILGSGNLAVQDVLVSGTNIKTINGTSLLGSGNIPVVTSPSGVSGAIQFSNGSAFASDAANLFWDDTNNRLGIGTNTPGYSIEAVGEIRGITQVSGQILALRRTSDGAVQSTIGFSAGLEINDTSGQGGRLSSVGATALKWLTSSSQPRVGIGFNGSILATAHIQGSGSTSATTSLLVQNSGGTAVLTVKDDRTSNFNGFIGGNNGILIGAQTHTNVNPAEVCAHFFYRRDSSGAFQSGFDLSTSTIQAYGSLGVGSSPVASAILQADSTTKGFLPPRMTTTQKNAIASPATGLVLYDSTTNKLQCYNGSTWNDLF
jgi:hypothetical protein